jgi:hypothetical protein
MYGLVNRAIGDLVCRHFDDATWQRIRARSGVAEDVFLSMETYPDSVTVALVVAASEELKLEPSTVLELFGEHWVNYAAAQGYRDLMQVRGDSLFAFISRLDDLHSRLALTFPELRPPSFKTADVTASSLRLHYFSEREGLASFVIGLVRGLGKLFGTPVDVVHDVPRGGSRDHHEFVVTLRT